MRNTSITRRAFAVGSFSAVVVVGLPQRADAQLDRVHGLMNGLKAHTSKLGQPSIQGAEKVGDKNVPALFFGTTKANNNPAIVDDFVKANGGTATLFVKAGEEYVRVATNVENPDGSRAVGTVLDPNGPVIAKIKAGEPYYGDANVLGKAFVAGYDPVKDAAGNIIGIYYVGYPKN